MRILTRWKLAPLVILPALHSMPRPTQLIVNADDFGAAPPVSAGIVDAHEGGIVTATTMLVNLEGFDDGVARARACPTLDLGLHLNLSWGRPLSSCPRLAPGGTFRGKRGALITLLTMRDLEAEIDAELDAQVARFSAALGRPSHLDVHQHLHMAPRLWRAVLRLATRHEVPFVRRPAERAARGLVARTIARVFRGRSVPAPTRTPDAFLGLGATGRLDQGELERLLGTIAPGLTELMVHPGHEGVDGFPDQLARTRAIELEALRAPGLRERLAERGIVLTSFAAAADA